MRSLQELRIERFTWPIAARDVERLATEVIRLQKANQLSKGEDRKTQNGFLVTLFKREELVKYLQQYAGSIYMAYSPKGDTAGFLLFTDMVEFVDQLNTPGSAIKWARPMSFEKCRYLYQVAVDPNYQKSGVASALLGYCGSLEGDKIIADILTEPHFNEACLNFLRKHGFAPVGELTMAAYRDFGSLKSVVVQRGL